MASVNLVVNMGCKNPCETMFLNSYAFGGLLMRDEIHKNDTVSANRRRQFQLSTGGPKRERHGYLATLVARAINR